ncbi:A24 family peptidase [Microlunatus sp. Gsoil 973]|uniref:A24 family peptidase n=1 Tax=Microlunatus sp. Gsoil 973 TaxID=2672569 RepID=UPI0012B49CF6|nr:A24 family peptidase [Microlunatus sp. Gsoil 973]QGN33329.1 hypothetical protein GJV80_11490 [Microlunatus sp. Gsoil 973]
MAANQGLLVAPALVVVVGVAVGLGGPALLRRLPEPVPPADADDDTRSDYLTKISYRSLATGRFGLITGLVAAALTAVAVLTQPPGYWAVWAVVGTIGVLLAAVDAITTWLPSPAMRLGWVAGAVAVLACLAADPDRIAMAIRIGGSVLIAGGGYLLLWMITRGRAIAFGDVRLMPLIGAVAGTMGWAGLYWSLLLGSLIGAVIGVVWLTTGRRGPFPYGPALVSGPYAAAVLISVLQ